MVATGVGSVAGPVNVLSGALAPPVGASNPSGELPVYYGESYYPTFARPENGD